MVHKQWWVVLISWLSVVHTLRDILTHGCSEVCVLILFLRCDIMGVLILDTEV